MGECEVGELGAPDTDGRPSMILAVMGLEKRPRIQESVT
jgi:hypothetical protein